MQLVVGQRFMSEAEPELGLGAVTDIAGKRVTISFSEGERIYGIATAPIKRVTFSVGDQVTLLTGGEGPITTLREEQGLLYYTVNGDEVSELFLSQNIAFTTPLDRLYRGLSDRNRDFEIRKLALSLQKQSISSPARGYVGGTMELFPHQFSVAQAICEARSRRFFLADEVGLGKTIEAALALHRLLLTGAVDRVLIVVPSALLHQWFIELYRRFSILATVVNDDFRNRFRRSGPEVVFLESPLIITSEDLAAKDDLATAVMGASWDMLIVDEAHHLTPDSTEYAQVAQLSRVIRDLLLLTASPDAMEEESFFGLLQLIDPVKFSSFSQFVNERDEYTLVAAMAESILAGKGLTTEELQFIEDRAPRLFTQYQKLKTSDEAEAFVRQLIDICGVGRTLFRNSRAVIAGFPDRKAQLVPLSGEENAPVPTAITDWIEAYLRERSDKKTLIICKDQQSLTCLERALTKVKSRKVALFHEDMSIVRLDRSAAWFADPDGASLLISTEIGAEGRNFQYADSLILADLPEQPEQLEQRIGRLDRIGRKMEVSVVIPYVVGTVHERLALWYHDGLNAFERTVPGAYLLGEEFIPHLKQDELRKNQWEQILSETKSRAAELRSRVEEGRSRLLELRSCNTKEALQLIGAVDASESDMFREQVESLFAYFGITMEEHGAGLYYLDFDMVTDHTFPIPALCEEGVTITFERQIALTREDVTYLTIDHPMVIGAVELLLSSEKGNCSCARLPKAGEEGYLVELLFQLEATATDRVLLDRYFPQQTIRLLLDDLGDPVDDIFEESYLSQTLETAQLSQLPLPTEELEERLSSLLDEARGVALDKQKRLQESAIAGLKSELLQEKTRLEDLGAVELLKGITAEYLLVVKAIQECQLRLDGVRMIVLEV